MPGLPDSRFVAVECNPDAINLGNPSNMADDESASTTYEITVISSDSKQTSVQFVGDYAAHIRAQSKLMKMSIRSLCSKFQLNNSQIWTT